jgi:hydrogenase-4 component F
VSNLAYLSLAPALLAPIVGARAVRSVAPLALAGVSVAQAAIAITIVFTATAGAAPLAGGYLTTDATARLFLVLVNLIFLGIAGYVWNRTRTNPELKDAVARFARLSLLFMSAANFVVLSNHLVASWIALEATTLAAAPLIVREGVPSSRRASFRYFLFSSLGLAVALAGLACLARGLEADGASPTFFLHELRPLTGGPANLWRRIGLALVVLGYGTKLGLAPMYSWLPETYDQAPPPTTALLAAVQFNCALVCLIRVLQVHRASGRELVSTELLVIGLLSMAVSTVSIIATRNFERLIAYASINHAGVIAIGLAIGESASYGVLLYVVSNAFIKAILFLTAGKIEAHYGTKDTREIAGLIKDLPYSGLFLMVGTFALLGFPPFGSFLGELIILSGLVRAKQILVFVVFCTLISLTFVATGRSVFPMIWGEPRKEVHWPRQSFLAAAPKLAFLVALVAMGIYMPKPVNALFREVAASLGAE